MRIEFTYARSVQYFRRLLRPAALRVVRRLVVLAVGLTVLGALLVVSSQGEGLATVVGLLTPVVSVSQLLRARQTYIEMVTVPASWTEPRTWVITDEGLESTGGLTSTMWTWPAAQRLDERPEAYVFWPDSGPMLDVPREPLKPEQEVALRAFLAERGLLPKSVAAAS